MKTGDLNQHIKKAVTEALRSHVKSAVDDFIEDFDDHMLAQDYLDYEDPLGAPHFCREGVGTEGTVKVRSLVFSNGGILCSNTCTFEEFLDESADCYGTWGSFLEDLKSLRETVDKRIAEVENRATEQ